MVSALFVLLNGKNINFRDILAQGGNVEAIISNNYQNLLAIILYIVIVYFINAYFNSLVSWTAYKVVKEEKTDVESSTSRVNKVFGAIAVFTSINIILKIISVFIKRSKFFFNQIF